MNQYFYLKFGTVNAFSTFPMVLWNILVIDECVGWWSKRIHVEMSSSILRNMKNTLALAIKVPKIFLTMMRSIVCLKWRELVAIPTARGHICSRGPLIILCSVVYSAVILVEKWNVYLVKCLIRFNFGFIYFVPIFLIRWSAERTIFLVLLNFMWNPQ